MKSEDSAFATGILAGILVAALSFGLILGPLKLHVVRHSYCQTARLLLADITPVRWKKGKCEFSLSDGAWINFESVNTESGD